jgi:hypothetical protein
MESAMPRTKRLPSAVPKAPKTSTNGDGPHDESEDLANLFESTTRELKIPDPRVISGTPVYSKFRIEISSIRSERARDAARAHREMLTLKDGKIDENDPALEDFLREQVVAATTRWWQTDRTEDGIVVDKEVLACTPENVRRVYQMPELAWLYRYVHANVFNTADFFGKRPKTD